jgi:thiol-disulfide isomerase/thioredoxin
MLLLAAPLLAEGGSGVTVLDDSNYAQVLSGADKPVLIYFFNKKCSDCVATAPIFRQIADEYAGRISFCATQIFDKPDHWSVHWDGLSKDKGNLESVPTFLFVRDNHELHRVTSSLNRDDVEGKKKSIKCLIDLVLLRQQSSANCSN